MAQDLMLKNKDQYGLTETLISNIIHIHNYKILTNDNLNITFERI